MAKGHEIAGESPDHQFGSVGPDLGEVPRWEEERDLFHSLCLDALAELRIDANREYSEPDLNRRMVRMFNRVVSRRERAGQEIKGHIVPEAKCLPNLRRPRFEAREKKVPDFRYQYRDTKEPEDFCTMEVVAECKILGHPERQLDFNKLYVQNGISRFRHAYAATSPSAFMIGYMQDMEPLAIHIAVSAHSRAATLNDLVLSSAGWTVAGVSTLDQHFQRVDPAGRFDLKHLWIDLRGSPKVRPPAKARKKSVGRKRR